MPTRQAPVTAGRTAEPSTLSLTATATFDLEAAANDEKKRPKCSITGYTGAVMSVGGFYSPVIVDLAGAKVASQTIPILRGHDTDRLVGQTDAARIDANGISFEGTITGENADATEVVSQAKNGFKWQASIGANIDRREFLDSGKTATVNGRLVTGPMVIARESTIFEISFVPIGADGQTSASVAASKSLGTPSGDPTMFEQWLQAKGFDPAALSDPQRASLRAMFDAEEAAKTKTPAPATQTLEQITAARRKENERVNRITQLAAEAMNDRPALVDEIDQMSKAAIEANSTVEQFELELLRLRAHLPAVHTRTDPKLGARVIEAALCQSGGLRDLEKHYDERTLEAADARFRHGLGLKELLVLAARENGRRDVSPSDVRGLLEAAFVGRETIRAEGFSTLSLPGTLGNVANKFLAQGFTAVESGWQDIASRRAVRDFKQVTSYSLTGDMKYAKVGPGGELKHADVGELSYTNQADTYGRMFAITRKDIINDDLGALTQVPFKLGRGAAIAINEVFWTAFLATRDTFWSTAHANVISGGTTALSSAALNTAQTKMRKQTDADSKPLGILPKLLLVPPELEITANELMTSLIVNTGGSSSTDKVPNRNIWNNKYQVVVSSYLSNTSITNYSLTHWFLLADPMDLPTIEVAFLNGRDTPVIESAEADFATLGIQMRGYHDFGVSLQEYRASVRSAGA